MCKIGILLLDRDFEHDIYELIKAFYPEGDIHSLYEKDEAVYDIFFTVKKDNDNFVIKYDTKDQKGVASAEVIRGADGDSSQETHEKLMDADVYKRQALNYSLEFSGGTSTNVTFNEDMDIKTIDSEVTPVVEEVTGDKNVQPTKVVGTNQVIIKTRSLNLDEREALNKAVSYTHLVKITNLKMKIMLRSSNPMNLNYGI